MRPRAWLVGLDYGQTQVKAVLVNSDTGAIERMVAVPPPSRDATCQVGSTTYRHLNDPEVLITTAETLIRQLVPDQPAMPVAVAVSSAGPPLVAVDRNLRPVWPVVGHWQGVSREELDEAFPYEPDRFYAEAGSPRWYQPPTFHLAWLQMHDPARAARVAGVLSIGGFVAARLSGVMAAEPSSAGSSGAVDRRTRSWSPSLLQAGRLDPAWFPRILPAGTALGENHTLLPGRRVTVATGAHDYLAAALAAGIDGPDRSLNVLGTWEMAAQFVDIGTEGGWGGDEPHGVLHDLHVLPGLGTQTLECWTGGQIEWARRILGLDAPQFFAAAERADPQAPRGRLYAPFLGHQFFPHAFGDRRSAFTGLDAGVGAGELARMVLEGLAYLGSRMFELLETVRTGAPPGLVLTGGASRSALVGQLKADMLNRPVYVHQFPDLSAVGAALLGGVGAGVIESLDQAATLLRSHVRLVEPDPDRHQAYREVFDALDWTDGRTS
ncbi:MAG: FGGY-family carbohydrate kinase [Clostridia bacterium]